jgi:hypothetical protein
MMKKLLFLGLAFSASVGVSNAQTARLKASALGPKVPVASELNEDAYFNGTRTPKAPSNNMKINARGSFGTKIGKSYYDLPSNNATPNRTLVHADGSISAVWTETCNGSGAPNYNTRGAGYNYFNGGNWTEGAVSTNEYQGTCGNSGADYGIATKRVGWPEIVSVGGNEMVFTHAEGISVNKRAVKGTGGMSGWGTTTDLAFTKNITIAGTTTTSGINGTWPRVVSSGNNIHMIYSLNKTVPTGQPAEPIVDGVQGMLVYNRSTDGGASWDKQNVKLPGLSDANGYTRIGGDAYAIHANGNNVAIVAGYFGQPWTLWKSTNNGDTWTRTVMKSLTPADTMNLGSDLIVAYTNDNAHSVVIDDQNNVHAFAGQLLMTVIDSIGSVFPGESYYPNEGQALYYWTDKTPTVEPVIIAEVENSKPVGTNDTWIANGAIGGRTPYGTMGMVSMASAAYDAAGNVYVVYNGVVRGTSNVQGDSTGQPFRDLYLTKMTASTGQWQATPSNIGRIINPFGNNSSPAENVEENVFPSAHHKVGADRRLHVTWMSDSEPGMNLGADADTERENHIMYAALNLDNLKATGISKDVAAFVNGINAYPNPTNGKVAINVDLKKSADVKVRITNIMGQEISTVNAGKLASGQNTVSVDMSNLANGIYLYTVSSNDFTVTNRIVKQ